MSDDDFRSEMHSALDPVRGLGPDRRILEARVLDRVEAERTRSRGWGWQPAAAAALVLLAVAAGVALSMHRFLPATTPGHTKPPAGVIVTPRESPLPSPLGTPPPGTPLVLVAGSGSASLGVGWDGKVYSLGKDGCAGSSWCIPSPDGRRELVTVNVNGQYNTTSVLDRETGHITELGRDQGTFRWADDSLHICMMVLGPNENQGNPMGGFGPTSLYYADSVTGAKRHVIDYGQWTFNGTVGPELLSCSAATDMAGMESALKTSETLVVRISTGQKLFSQTYPGTSYAVMSMDSTLMALNDTSAGSAQILAIPAGTPLSSIPAGHEVRGFTADGRTAVEVYPDSSYPSGLDPALVNWKTGAVEWSAPSGLNLRGLVAQPGGSGLMLDLAGQIWLFSPVEGVRHVADGSLLNERG